MAIAAIIEWLKKNFLTLVLLFVIAFLISKQTNYFNTYKTSSAPQAIGGLGMAESVSPNYLRPEAPPTTDVQNRLVVQNSNLSLQVSNVVETSKKIISKAQSLAGYMVDSHLSKPEESTSGNVTVRVPADKLEDFLSFCRGLAVKVVSENLLGTDVTDQYVNTQARIDTLEKTKKKFEDILDKAVNVQDILTVQRELINVQEQIDSLTGQNKYLEQTAKLAKVTVYLASDELELPYAPAQGWRPAVIFKTAVRSLVSFARFLGTAAIWIGVFSVIWLPVLLIIILVKRRQQKPL